MWSALQAHPDHVPAKLADLGDVVRGSYERPGERRYRHVTRKPGGGRVTNAGEAEHQTYVAACRVIELSRAGDMSHVPGNGLKFGVRGAHVHGHADDVAADNPGGPGSAALSGRASGYIGLLRRTRRTPRVQRQGPAELAVLNPGLR